MNTKQPQQILSELSHAKHNSYQPENQLQKNFTTDLQGATQSCRKQLKMQPTLKKKSKETYNQNRNAQNIHAPIVISSLTIFHLDNKNSHFVALVFYHLFFLLKAQ